LADFARFAGFYLRWWAADLAAHFPFLDEGRDQHPYRTFYYIWRLSYLFGVRYCDHSVRFEDLVEDPAEAIAALFEAVGADSVDRGPLRSLVVAMPLGRWREYADDSWFRGHEAACEAALAEFLGPDDTTEGADRRGISSELGASR
jgi:hypothetical protein